MNASSHSDYKGERPAKRRRLILDDTEAAEFSELDPKNVAQSPNKLVICESIPKAIDTKESDLFGSPRLYQNVSLIYHHASNAEEKFAVLERNAKSVVDLDLLITSDQLLRMLPHGMKFPKLTSLRTNHAEKMIETCFEDVTGLEKLSLPLLKGNHIRDEITFFLWLKKQHKLQELQFISHRGLCFECDLLCDVPFKLTMLTWHNYELKEHALVYNQRKNFDTFLLKMSPTLVHLELATCFPEDVKVIINGLKALRTLRLGRLIGTIQYMFNNKELKANRGITSFKFGNNFWQAQPLPTLILRMLVNLEVLQLDTIEDPVEDLAWIASHMTNLKTLIYSSEFTGSPTLDEANQIYQFLIEFDGVQNENIEIRCMQPQ